MGLLTKDDSKLYREWFKEMARLRGIRVIYRYAVFTSETIHSEFNSCYSEPIDIDVIFDTNPRASTLKKIGWVSESPDDKPYIVYLPYDLPHLNTESVIDIPPEIDERTLNDIVSDHHGKPPMRPRRFKVTTINQLIEFPDCWICTLAPVFDTEDVDNNYESTNFNFIENPKEDGNIKLGLI